MAEWSANAAQTVTPNAPVIFTDNPVPPVTDLVRHRDETGAFLLRGYDLCPRRRSSKYHVIFNANIAIPTGGTVGPISIAATIDGSVIPATTAIVTPASVEEFFNVCINFDALIWNGCCESVSIINTSSGDILVQNANIEFNR